ncbi:MAG: hypothetical protein KDD48_03545 [Bdellovibrionales bacterium]|nr:hypothetical protein [Bdellovibrionales bacterium]
MVFNHSKINQTESENGIAVSRLRGLQRFRERECPKLPIGFFTYHDRLEDQHAAHTKDDAASGSMPSIVETVDASHQSLNSHTQSEN